MTTLKSEVISEVESLIQQDPGQRGLAFWASQGDIKRAAESLLKAHKVSIFTGFYIPFAGEIETDGPPGALILARALQKLGIEVCLFYDAHSNHCMEPALSELDVEIDYFPLPERGISCDLSYIDDSSHVLSIERPGPASDGEYYNFRGDNISQYHYPLENIFRQAKIRIAIGDGGNELGMGKVAQRVQEFHKLERPFACVENADMNICTGVSNWGGYALACLLSVLSKQNLMLDLVKTRQLIVTMIEAGAVDGISGKQERSVDGLGKTWEIEIYRSLYEIAAR